MQFKRWFSRAALGAGFGVACLAGSSFVPGRLAAAELGVTSATHGAVTSSVDQQRAAEKSFSDLYGKDEKAALSSRDSADNIALAKTLFSDSQKSSENPALAEVMRAHAAGLLFRSNDKAAYDMAIDLEKAALEADKADPLVAAQMQAEMLAQGVKDIPAGERAPYYGKLVGLFQALATLQIKAHDADGAVKSLSQVANYANAANDKTANKDANALMLVLRPMSSNSVALAKDLDALQKTPDDKTLNTEVSLMLLRDWGEAGTAGSYVSKADPAVVKGLMEMAKYETGGKETTGLDANGLKTLAEAYETWSKDGRDSKLGHLILAQRAAELYQALASSEQGADAAAATKNADRLAADANRYEKEAGVLLSAVGNGISSSGGSASSGGGSSAGGAGAIPQKSLAEVDKLIDTVGATDPDWLAGTQLNYPSTLDLTWMQPPRGTPWNANKILGQYIWSTVNQNPSQWKNGVKVMYKVLDVNKNDPAKLSQTYNALARMYFNYFKDFARAAYWWKKAGNTDHVDMAHCYFHLGNLAQAKKILQGEPFDTSRHGDIINAWGVFGDVDRALKVAEARMQTSSPDVGWLIAGDVCRLAGRYDEALKYYDGFLKLKQLTGDGPKNKQRAQDGYDTIKYFNLFDLSKVPDGTYKGSATGYRGAVESEVTVKGHKIADLKVNHREDQFYSSVTDIPAQIMEKQTVKHIDACSGATMTSNAIVMGTAKALGNAAQ